MPIITNQDLNVLINHYDKNTNLLSLLVGGYLTHMRYGKGEVVFVDSTKYGVFFDVNFENGATYTLSIDAFKRGDFTNIILSEEAFTEITAYIKPFVEEIARKEKEEKKARIEQKDIATEKHKEFLSEIGMPYKGTNSNSYKKHRVTHCYNCKNKLDNMINIECRACGWIICNCGACGCGYDR